MSMHQTGFRLGHGNKGKAGSFVDDHDGRYRENFTALNSEVCFVALGLFPSP